MNSPSSTPSATTTRSDDTLLRGALEGLLPLGLLAGLVALTLALTALARQIVTPQGFFAEQLTDVIVVVVGLALAAVVYVVATVRALRRVAQWQRDGAQATPRAALVALALSALVVLTPVLLALLLPQHPAP